MRSAAPCKVKITAQPPLSTQPLGTMSPESCRVFRRSICYTAVILDKIQFTISPLDYQPTNTPSAQAYCHFNYQMVLKLRKPEGESEAASRVEEIDRVEGDNSVRSMSVQRETLTIPISRINLMSVSGAMQTSTRIPRHHSESLDISRRPGERLNSRCSRSEECSPNKTSQISGCRALKSHKGR